jgi:hypothetical protein
MPFMSSSPAKKSARNTRCRPPTSEASEAFRVLQLDALVRMKLTSFRDKDRTHLRDMLDVGLVDESWLGRLPEFLAARLRMLIENPDG